MVNLLEVTISPEIFVRHYWSPNMKQDIERVRKAIDGLADRLTYYDRFLKRRFLWYIHNMNK
jgi:hypothetical protein